VESPVGIRAQDLNSRLGLLPFDPARPFLARLTGQVADRRSDHCHAVPLLNQMPRQLVVAGSSGFVERRKGLVNEQDVHAVILLELGRARGKLKPQMSNVWTGAAAGAHAPSC
jgi:hypothetical protein